MREFVKQIVASLREDDTWKADTHWLYNDKLRVKVWIANGFWFVHMQYWVDARNGFSGDISLSLIEKAWLWPAVRKCRKLNKRRKEEAITAAIVSRRLSSGETK